MTLRAIAAVAEAYKRNKQLQPSFQPHEAIAYDRHDVSRQGADSVSLLTVSGRIVVPFCSSRSQAALLSRPWRQDDLFYQDGAFHLSVSVEAPAPLITCVRPT